MGNFEIFIDRDFISAVYVKTTKGFARLGFLTKVEQPIKVVDGVTNK